MPTRRSQPAPILTALALVVYSAVMVALTMLKAFYVIGWLWDPAEQRNRSLSLIPFNDFAETASWFGPLFDYLGNLAFFVPFGVLVYMLLADARRPLLWATGCGLVFSLGVETAQYVFALGYTDIDDVIMNTLGALLGALVARLLGPRFYPVWIWLALLLGVVFAVLVGLGDRLGDPDQVVQV